MSDSEFYVSLFFIIFLIAFSIWAVLLVDDPDAAVRKFFRERRKKRNQSDVSKEAERTEGSSSEDLWEEIMRENQREQREQLEARSRDQHAMAELRRIRMMRESREEMLRNYHEQMEEQRHRRNNTTQVDYDYHYMGSWNMADSPNTHRASAYNQGDVVRLHFPEDQRDHIGQLLHEQVVRLDSPREDYAGEWYCSFVNPTTMPEAFRERRVCVREYFFVPAEPEPDTFVVGDVVRLEFPEHERFIHGDYSWQRRQTIEGLLHGQYVILRHQHPGAPHLWDVSILNKADCPPSLIGRQLVAREKYFIKKQPAPAKAYPKKVKLTEGGLPKL